MEKAGMMIVFCFAIMVTVCICDEESQGNQQISVETRGAWSVFKPFINRPFGKREDNGNESMEMRSMTSPSNSLTSDLSLKIPSKRLTRRMRTLRMRDKRVLLQAFIAWLDYVHKKGHRF